MIPWPRIGEAPRKVDDQRILLCLLILPLRIGEPPVPIALIVPKGKGEGLGEEVCAEGKREDMPLHRNIEGILIRILIALRRALHEGAEPLAELLPPAGRELI